MTMRQYRPPICDVIHFPRREGVSDYRFGAGPFIAEQTGPLFPDDYDEGDYTTTKLRPSVSGSLGGYSPPKYHENRDYIKMFSSMRVKR